MQNFARFLLIGCLVAWPVAAQRGGGGHGGGGGFHGGGGGGFHGGGGGFHGSGGFGGGGFRGGYGGFRGYGGFGRGYYGYNRFGFGFGWGLGYYPYSWYWPYYDWGYPYYDYPYYGYGYGNSYPYASYDYGYSSSPVVVYQSNPAPVTIYESPRAARPETRDYRPSSSQGYEKPIYLIAFKNQSNIRAADTYWVTGGTLHFITLQHEQRQAPLDSVDRVLTSRLNRERHVDVQLPETQ